MNLFAKKAILTALNSSQARIRYVIGYLRSGKTRVVFNQELLESADARSLKLWKNLKLGIMQGHRAPPLTLSMD